MTVALAPRLSPLAVLPDWTLTTPLTNPLSSLISTALIQLATHTRTAQPRQWLNPWLSFLFTMISTPPPLDGPASSMAATPVDLSLGSGASPFRPSPSFLIANGGYIAEHVGKKQYNPVCECEGLGLTPFFAFTNPEHFPIALALDLLLPPPAQGRGHFTACSACATIAHPGGKPLAGPGDRHFVACPHGLKLHSTAHDPTVQALVPFLDAILGSSRVTAERGGLGGQRAVDQWMQGAGAGVDHAPDIILRDFDKAGTYVLIDIKTLDAAGPSHVAAHHTDRARLTYCSPCHRALTHVAISMGFSLLTCALSSWLSALAGLSILRVTLSSRA